MDGENGTGRRDPDSLLRQLGKTRDRYTVVYKDFPEQQCGCFLSLGMNEDPTHPQGFGQHTTAMRGSHLGRRVPFETLPERCQRVIEVDLGAVHA